jgi:hypothetical protein
LAEGSQVNPSDHRIPIVALFFITLAALWSGATPIVGLWASIVWAPFSDILRRYELGPFSILLIGSAIGYSGYWLLVRQFWLKSLRRADWLRTVGLWVTATLLAGLATGMLDGYVRGLNVDILDSILTVTWLFVLDFTVLERNERANEQVNADD